MLVWFFPDLGWRNIWNLIVFCDREMHPVWLYPWLAEWPVEAEGNPYFPHELQRDWIWGSAWWVGLQISSLMRWILPSVVLRSALCQGKLPTSWTCTYLLIFFCNSKFTAGFIYFYFLNHFLWTKVCWKQTANQTPFWCGCRIITSDVWHLTDTQRVT